MLYADALIVTGFNVSRFINGNSDKNGSTLADLSHADIPHADASTSEDSEHNASSIDATTTLGSTDEAGSMQKVEGVVISDDDSVSEGEDFYNFNIYC
nr:hypothetical protein [Tanacetum cinerariifolium]